MEDAKKPTTLEYEQERVKKKFNVSFGQDSYFFLCSFFVCFFVFYLCRVSLAAQHRRLSQKIIYQKS